MQKNETPLHFRLAIFENITVGLPFCMFKLASGLHFIQDAKNFFTQVVGALLMGLGGIDLFVNTANLVGLTVLRRSFFSECFFAILLNTLQRPKNASRWGRIEFGKSIDVLVSFSIVAVVIGGSFISEFSPLLGHAWNIAVILNVLGAGLMRFSSSLKKISI